MLNQITPNFSAHYQSEKIMRDSTFIKQLKLTPQQKRNKLFYTSDHNTGLTHVWTGKNRKNVDAQIWKLERKDKKFADSTIYELREWDIDKGQPKVDVKA